MVQESSKDNRPYDEHPGGIYTSLPFHDFIDDDEPIPLEEPDSL